MKKLLLLLLFISCNNQSDENDEPILNQQTAEVYLLNTLNDSRGYCIDMKGYKTDADINTTHCKHILVILIKVKFLLTRVLIWLRLLMKNFIFVISRFVWKQSLLENPSCLEFKQL